MLFNALVLIFSTNILTQFYVHKLYNYIGENIMPFFFGSYTVNNIINTNKYK